MEPDAQQTAFMNDVFISYSRKDIGFASALEKSLENYAPPRGLNIPRRNLVIFRDESDMTGSDYYASIEKHLKGSAKLLVVCSPYARESNYVNDEIRRFAEIHGPQNIVPVLISGMPNNEATEPEQEKEKAFPEALCDVMEMPLAASYVGFDPKKERVNRGGFYGSWHKILADIYGVSRDEIEERDRKRRARRRIVVSGIAGIAGISAILAAIVIVTQQRNLAIKRRVAIAQELAAQAIREGQEGDIELAALLTRKAFLINQRYGGEQIGQIDRALRSVLEKPFFNLHFVLRKGEPTSVAFRPDDSGIAVGDVNLGVWLWNISERRRDPILLTNPSGGIRTVVFDAAGHLLAASEEGDVLIWEAPLSQSPIVVLKLTGIHDKCSLYKFDDNGQRLAAGCTEGAILVWDLTLGQSRPLRLLNPKGSIKIRSLVFSPADRQLLAAGYADGTVHIWNLLQPTKPVQTLPGQSEEITALQFSQDGRFLAVAAERSLASAFSSVLKGGDEREFDLRGGKVTLWDLRRIEAGPTELGRHGHRVTSLMFSPDGKTLASAGGGDGTVSIFSFTTPSSITRTTLDHKGMIVAIAFSHRGDLLASLSCGDGGEIAPSLFVWDLRRPLGSPIILKDHASAVQSLAFNRIDGTLASAGGSDQTLLLWDTERKKIMNSLPHDEMQVVAVAFSPDGQTLASGTKSLIGGNPSFSVLLWDPNKPDKPKAVLKGHSSEVRSLAFSYDGKLLASAGLSDDVIMVWRPDRPEAEPISVNARSKNVLSLAFAPFGQILAWGSKDGKIRILDISKHLESPDVLPGHSKEVLSLAFSPDGRLIASAGADNQVLLWDYRRGRKAPLILSGQGGAVHAIAIDQKNGKYLASAGADGLRIWDLKMPKAEPVVVSRPGGELYVLAFSPDGLHIAVGDSDGNVVIWPTTARLADMVCKLVWRNLSCDEWKRFVGADIAYETTCKDLPPGCAHRRASAK